MKEQTLLNIGNDHLHLAGFHIHQVQNSVFACNRREINTIDLGQRLADATKSFVDAQEPYVR